MATDVETLCEMALAHLSMADEITNVSTDQTAVARAFRRFYAPTRDELLRMAPWAFATRFFTLTGHTGSGTVTVSTNVGTFTTSQDGFISTGDTVVIGGVDYTVGARTSGTVWALTGANVTAQAFTIEKAVTTDPNVDWKRSYRIPTDALIVRRLVDGNRQPTRNNWPVYRMAHDGTYQVLYTDYEQDVVIEYTKAVTDVTVFTPTFDAALAALLAFKVAPLLAKGDPNGLGNRALQVANLYLNQALAEDANQDRPDGEAESEAVQYRNGSAYWDSKNSLRNR